jgi:hypothetical protein
MPRITKPLLYLIGLLGLYVLVVGQYFLLFNAPFYQDDFECIWHGRITPLADMFRDFSNFRITFYRPFDLIDWTLGHYLLGETPAFWYLVILFLHAVNAFLAYILAQQLLRNKVISILTAITFALFYPQYEAFFIIDDMAGIVYGIFMLISLILIFRFLKAPKLRFIWMAWFCFAIALCYKEEAAPYFAILPLIILLFRDPKKLKASIERWFVILLPCIIILVTYVGIRYQILLNIPAYQETNYVLGPHIPLNYLKNMAHALFFTHILISQTVPTNIIFAAMLLVGIYSLVHKGDKLNIFFLLWFFLTITPDTPYIHGINSRYVYLKSLAWIMLGYKLLWQVYADKPRLKGYIWSFIGLYLVINIGLNFYRQVIWNRDARSDLYKLENIYRAVAPLEPDEYVILINSGFCNPSTVGGYFEFQSNRAMFHDWLLEDTQLSAEKVLIYGFSTDGTVSSMDSMPREIPQQTIIISLDQKAAPASLPPINDH